MKLHYIIILLTALLAFPLRAGAQKITLGSCYTKDGGLYKGEMMGGKPQGKGTTTYPNHDVYEGEYLKGKRSGKGTYTFSDGERYEGMWYQDHQHGKGNAPDRAPTPSPQDSSTRGDGKMT